MTYLHAWLLTENARSRAKKSQTSLGGYLRTMKVKNVYSLVQIVSGLVISAETHE